MTDFANVLAELQFKLDAAMKVIAQHPEVAAEVAKAIDTVIVPTAEQEEVLQDQARANALAVALRQAREVLPVPPPPLRPGATGSIDPTDSNAAVAAAVAATGGK